MLRQLFGHLSSDLAVDLGTANTLVGVAGEGLVLDEPSVVAVQQRVITLVIIPVRLLGDDAPESGYDLTGGDLPF